MTNQTNRVRAEGWITLADGKERKVRFDMNAIIVLEEAIGAPIGRLKTLIDTEQISSVRLLRALLFAGLAGHSEGDKSLTLESVGDLIDISRLGEIDALIMDLFNRSMHPGNAPATGEAAPKNGTGKKR